MNATDRVASIRDEYSRRGEDVSNLSDVELLIRALDWADAEINRLNKREEDRRCEAADSERAVRTAARGYYERQLEAMDKLIFQSLSKFSGETVRAALYRAANLGGSPSSADVADTCEAAATALRLWEREMQYVTDGDVRHESVNMAVHQRQEITRLRKLITDYAVAIANHTRNSSARRVCVCPGCELVRAIDDVDETPERAAA
ncbi:hypothetical protein AB0P37_08400 [Streptomyces antimycoticus]|uniref:hypothetical protein n=1 Tax=Streptomyces antimycoticus TaxID=68175 RepID=UPI003444C51B